MRGESNGHVEEAFAVVYRRTYRKTLAYAWRRTRSAADAHDVVAETYLVAWRRVDELFEMHEPQAWLYGVAFRVLGNQRRSNTRRQELIQKAGLYEKNATNELNPLWLAEKREEMEVVAAAMSKLSDRDQEVLRLAAFEELDHEEIARALGVNRALVRSILYRARRRLGKALDQTDVPPGHSFSPERSPDE